MLLFSSPSGPASVKSHSRLEVFINASARILIRAKEKVSVSPELATSRMFQALMMFKRGLMPRFMKTYWVNISWRSGQYPQA